MDNTKNTSDQNSEKNTKPITFEIPAEGSLGLLALGAVGIKAWRKKRDEAKAQQINNPTK